MKHTCIKHFGHIASVEVVEVRIVERHRDFDGSVSAEVEQNHAVAVVHCADGLTVFFDDESGQILVDNAGIFVAVSFDGFGCARKSSALPVNVGVEACFNHIPVCEISVHRDDHTTAAACYAGVEIIVVQFRHSVFEHIDVSECARCRNVSAVKQNMNEHFLYAVAFCALNQGD